MSATTYRKVRDKLPDWVTGEEGPLYPHDEDTINLNYNMAFDLDAFDRLSDRMSGLLRLANEEGLSVSTTDVSRTRASLQRMVDKLNQLAELSTRNEVKPVSTICACGIARVNCDYHR